MYSQIHLNKCNLKTDFFFYSCKYIFSPIKNKGFHIGGYRHQYVWEAHIDRPINGSGSSQNLWPTKLDERKLECVTCVVWTVCLPNHPSWFILKWGNSYFYHIVRWRNSFLYRSARLPKTFWEKSLKIELFERDRRCCLKMYGNSAPFSYSPRSVKPIF